MGLHPSTCDMLRKWIPKIKTKYPTKALHLGKCLYFEGICVYVAFDENWGSSECVDLSQSSDTWV